MEESEGEEKGFSKRFEFELVSYVVSPSFSPSFSSFLRSFLFILVSHHSRSVEEGSDGGEGGHLCDTISRRTLFYLIATLNASFHPDYDFSNAKSDEFSKEPSISVSNPLHTPSPSPLLPRPHFPSHETGVRNSALHLSLSLHPVNAFLLLENVCVCIKGAAGTVLSLLLLKR